MNKSKQVKKKVGFKCYDCKHKSPTYNALVKHYHLMHNDSIPKGMSIDEYIFRRRNKNRTVGLCVVCKEPSKFNEETRKFNRTCGKASCKKVLRDAFKKNIKNATGRTHEEIMNDPEEQKRRLMNRTISGTVKLDSGVEMNYTGSYERDFVEQSIKNKWYDMDLLMWSPEHIVFEYEYKDKVRHYIPDYYIRSPFNLVIEIKDGGDNPNKHYADRDMEYAKDLAVIDSGKYNYIKITNKEYYNFIQLLNHLKDIDMMDKQFKPVYVIPEQK